MAQPRRLSLVACGVVVAAMQCLPAFAGPGDVFVPAHRTSDGSYVPANVPTTSGGTHLANRPRRAAAVTARSTPRPGNRMPPLFLEARPVSR